MARAVDHLPVAVTSTTATAEIDWKLALAIAYLALPNYIFFVGWFRTLPAALAVVMVTLVLISVGRRTRRDDPTFRLSIQAWLLTVSIAWACFGGGSHLMYANPDWYIRDAVMGDLARQEWPVAYSPNAGGVWVLRSAIGYFLPPAIVGKLCGMAALPAAILIWTAIGIFAFLNLLPLPTRSGMRLAAAISLVVFFSGMDFVGQVISTESLPDFPLRLEWWGPFSYPSLTTQILWAPNHCIPLLLGTMVLVRHSDHECFPLLAGTVIAFALIWTPFVLPGLAPLAAFLLARRKHAGLPFTMQLSAAVSAFLVAAIVLLFLATDISGIASSIPLPVDNGTPSVPATSMFSASYLLFVCCEFAFLGLVLLGNPRQSLGCFVFSLLALFVLPLFRYGPTNDLMLRASTPYLLVIMLECLHTFFGAGQIRSRMLAAIAAGMLAIGAHTTFNEFWRGATYPRTPADYGTSLLAKQGGHPPAHYMGRLYESRWLAPLLKPHHG